MMSTCKINIYLICIFTQTAFAAMPCNPEAGVAAPEKGSGACTGNIQLAIPLPTTGMELDYNTITSTGNFGYGTAGWRLSVDARLKNGNGSIYFNQDTPTIIIESADGTQRRFEGSSHINWKSANPAISRSTLRYENSMIIEEAKDHSKVTYRPYVSGGTYLFWVAYNAVGTNPYDAMTIQRVASGYISKITYPYNRAINFTLQNNRTEGITDVASNNYKLKYDDLNRLSSIGYPDGTGWTITYQGSSNLVSKLSTTWGQTTDLTYQNNDGIIQSILTEKGYRTNYSYTANTVTVQNQIDKLTETFNDNHVLIKSERNGSVSEYVTNENRLPVLVTGPIGDTTVFEYDNRQNLISFQDTDGVTTTYKYDERDNVTQVKVGPLTSKYTYDENDRLASLVSADGKSYTILRNQYGSITQVKEGNKTIATIAYDTKQLVTRVTDEANLSQNFDYLNGMLVNFTDPLGRTTSFQRNVFGLATQTSLPGGLVESTAYDSMGRVTESKVSNGGSKSLGVKIARTAPTLASVKAKKVKYASVISFGSSNEKPEITIKNFTDGNETHEEKKKGGDTFIDGVPTSNCEGCSTLQDTPPPSPSPEPGCTTNTIWGEWKEELKGYDKVTTITKCCDITGTITQLRSRICPTSNAIGVYFGVIVDTTFENIPNEQCEIPQPGVTHTTDVEAYDSYGWVGTIHNSNQCPWAN